MKRYLKLLILKRSENTRNIRCKSAQVMMEKSSYNQGFDAGFVFGFKFVFNRVILIMTIFLIISIILNFIL